MVLLLLCQNILVLKYIFFRVLAHRAMAKVDEILHQWIQRPVWSTKIRPWSLRQYDHGNLPGEQISILATTQKIWYVILMFTLCSQNVFIMRYFLWHVCFFLSVHNMPVISHKYLIVPNSNAFTNYYFWCCFLILIIWSQNYRCRSCVPTSFMPKYPGSEICICFGYLQIERWHR